MSTNKQPVVLAIAGFDPSAGAGVLADIKTISAFGCYGLGVVTSLTMQNTREVLAAHHQERGTISGQLLPLFADFEIAAVKTGMLPTVEVVEEVAAFLSTNPVPRIVVDPVARSTSGHELMSEEALAALINLLFPMSSVVTPNWDEAERITRIAIRDAPSAKKAACAILELGPGAVLVKGGGAASLNATDLLVDAKGAAWFRSPKIRSRNTHGTGCTLASAIACLLARGGTLRESIPIAKEYIREAILTAPDLGSGQGPLNHFPPEWIL
jgi:hydroxymethylpyrimidine/phosphomethylpyrimidine kinase